MVRFKKYYEDIISYDLLTKFNYINIMQVPRVLKIIIHLTIRESIRDQKAIFLGLFILEVVSGQKARITKIKRPLSIFKTQRNMIIGCKVTLRRSKMYYFFDKLLVVSIPAIKLFEGYSVHQIIDKDKKLLILSIGINDINCFPEIKYFFYKFLNLNKIGLAIQFFTSAQTLIERNILLKSFSVPIIL